MNECIARSKIDGRTKGGMEGWIPSPSLSLTFPSYFRLILPPFLFFFLSLFSVPLFLLSLPSFALQSVQQQLGNGGKGPLNQLPGPVPLPVGQPGSPGPPGPEGPPGDYVSYYTHYIAVLVAMNDISHSLKTLHSRIMHIVMHNF